MSSEHRRLALEAAPRPPRPYQLIVLVDAKTLREIKRRQGRGPGKLSRSEVVYQLLTMALEDRRDPFDVPDAA